MDAKTFVKILVDIGVQFKGTTPEKIIQNEEEFEFKEERKRKRKNGTTEIRKCYLHLYLMGNREYVMPKAKIHGEYLEVYHSWQIYNRTYVGYFDIMAVEKQEQIPYLE